jgi:hypothetical protein
MSQDNADGTNIVNVLTVADISSFVDKLSSTSETSPLSVDKGIYMLAEPQYVKSGLASNALVLNVTAEGEDSSTFVRFREQCLQMGHYQCEIIGITIDPSESAEVEAPALHAVTYTELVRDPNNLMPDAFNHQPNVNDIFWEMEMENSGVVNYSLNFMVADLTTATKPSVVGYFVVKSSLNIGDPQD